MAREEEGEMRGERGRYIKKGGKKEKVRTGVCV